MSPALGEHMTVKLRPTSALQFSTTDAIKLPVRHLPCQALKPTPSSVHRGHRPVQTFVAMSTVLQSSTDVRLSTSQEDWRDVKDVVYLACWAAILQHVGRIGLQEQRMADSVAACYHVCSHVHCINRGNGDGICMAAHLALANCCPLLTPAAVHNPTFLDSVATSANRRASSHHPIRPQPQSIIASYS